MADLEDSGPGEAGNSDLSPRCPKAARSRCSGLGRWQREARQQSRLPWVGMGSQAARVSKKRDARERAPERCTGPPSRLIRTCWEKFLEEKNQLKRLERKIPWVHPGSPPARLEKPIIQRARGRVFGGTLSQWWGIISLTVSAGVARPSLWASPQRTKLCPRNSTVPQNEAPKYL